MTATRLKALFDEKFQVPGDPAETYGMHIWIEQAADNSKRIIYAKRNETILTKEFSVDDDHYEVHIIQLLDQLKALEPNLQKPDGTYYRIIIIDRFLSFPHDSPRFPGMHFYVEVDHPEDDDSSGTAYLERNCRIISRSFDKVVSTDQTTGLLRSMIEEMAVLEPHIKLRPNVSIEGSAADRFDFWMQPIKSEKDEMELFVSIDGKTKSRISDNPAEAQAIVVALAKELGADCTIEITGADTPGSICVTAPGKEAVN